MKRTRTSKPTRTVKPKGPEPFDDSDLEDEEELEDIDEADDEDEDDDISAEVEDEEEDDDEEEFEIGFAPFVISDDQEWELSEVISMTDEGETVILYKAPDPENKQPAKWYKLAPVNIGEIQS